LDSTFMKLSRHLRENAARYYPDLGAGDVRVDCLGSREGALSTVYRFRIRSRDLQRDVVVKLPPSRRTGDSGPASGATRRPRVAPLLDPCTKYQSEHAALRAIEQHFDGLDDARFGAVRMLDFLSADHAVVMEETRGRSLTSLAADANRLRRPLGSRRLESAFGNTGAWLRSYHDLPALAHTRVRSATRKEFVTSVQGLTRFLVSAHPTAQLVLDRVTSQIEALASAWLSPTLPLGTGHGDLAPRNVIVDPSGRVTVLDTRAAWRVPIYEDIAYFLTAAKTPRVQAASLGLAFGRAALGRLERAFLRGYFAGDPIPTDRIRLFEIQSLLDKWASNTQGREQSRGFGWIAGAYRDWSTDRLFQRSVGSLVARFRPPEVAA
jgi:aminoglycoside phosphotransferase (APT) family kinase protein